MTNVEKRSIQPVGTGSLAERIQRGGEIAVPNTIELVFLVAGQRRGEVGASLDLARLRTRSIVDENPRAVQEIQALAFYRPDIYDSECLTVDPQNQLREIRSRFGSLIQYFPKDRLESVLSGFPAIKERISEDRELLSLLPDSPIIDDTELALKFLLDNSTVASLNDLDVQASYQRIITAHEFYKAISDEVEEFRTSLTYQDEQNFNGLGTRLLQSRRLFEIDPGSIDIDYNTDHPDRDTGFRGHIALVRATLALSDLLGGGSGNSQNERSKNLGKQAQLIIDKMVRDYPDRLPEISRHFGKVVGMALHNWTQTAGETDFSYDPALATGPHMSRAEVISSQHTGD